MSTKETVTVTCYACDIDPLCEVEVAAENVEEELLKLGWEEMEFGWVCAKSAAHNREYQERMRASGMEGGAGLNALASMLGAEKS